MRHVFQTRFGHLEHCPRCGVADPWREERKHLRYRCHRCGCRLHPFSGTLLENLKSSPRTLLYAILFSSNAVATPAVPVLARHLGWNGQRCKTFAKRMRAHFCKREQDRQLGQDGLPVHVQLFRFSRLYRTGEKGRKSARIVVLSDARAVAVSVVPLVAPVWIFRAVRRWVAESTPVFSHEPEFAAKLARYKQRRNEVVQMTQTSRDEWERVNQSYAFWVNARSSIKRTYYIISVDNVSEYLGEQVFRFNYRDEGLFWHILANFP